MTGQGQPWAAVRAGAVSLSLAALVWATVAAARGTAPAGDIELWGYDLLVNAAGYEQPHPDLMIVDFDDATLERTGVFPVPRATVAELIRRPAFGSRRAAHALPGAAGGSRKGAAGNPQSRTLRRSTGAGAGAYRGATLVRRGGGVHGFD